MSASRLPCRHILPLPYGVQPMTLSGIPQVVTSPFTWDTGSPHSGSRAADVDAELTRLYTNCTPTTPGT